MTKDEIDKALGGAEVVFQGEYNDLLNAIAKLVADAEGAWIPCEERMPECGEPFLIYLSKKNLVRQGFRTSGKLWFLDDGDPAPAVTHWRPLPKPPEPT
jgi:hypothetical protein